MTATTMRAAVARGPGRIERAEIPRPEPGPGEVRVRVSASGLCGTDLHFHDHGLYAPGLTPGHEIAGEIETLGSGVEDLSPGQTVAVEPILACGTCPACSVGRGSICRDARFLGLHVNGGFAEAVIVPRHRVFPTGAELGGPLLALAEPTAVVLHGLRRGSLAPGQRVLVLGAGAIGLLAVAAARQLGAGEVWITARHPHQAEHARALGADRVLEGEETQAVALDALGRATPFDLVLEAVGGGADTLGAAVAAVRPGGTVSVVGVFLGSLALDAFPLLLKEVSLVWSNCYVHGEDHADFADALTLLASRRDAIAPLLTHEVGLDEIERAYGIAADKKAGVIKVSVVP